MATKEAWAGLIRRDRHIGDFRRWKDHHAYMQTFEDAAARARHREHTRRRPAADLDVTASVVDNSAMSKT
jgi:hypothetical protein